MSDEAALGALQAAVDALAALVPDEVDGGRAAALVVGIQQQVGRLTAVAARLMPVVEAEVAWVATGARSVTAWLATATSTSYPRARALVTMGRALRDDLPLTSEAAVRGDVPIDRVETLARLAPTSPERRAALAGDAEACGEAFLLAEAQQQPADSFRTLVRRWAAAADPESDERGYREACEREFLELSATMGGFHLAGFLTTEHGASLRTALDAIMGAPAPGDARPTTQRRAQGLADMSRLVLDQGLVGAGSAVRPHLSVVVDLETLHRALGRGAETAERAKARACTAAATNGLAPTGGAPPTESGCSGGGGLRTAGDSERFAVAELLGAGPIPASVLARLACDSQIDRVIFGAASQVIDVGRSERTFAGAQRRAVIARDRTCRFPGCSAPAALSEVHHVDEWFRDHGSTDVNRGILLCWHHHDYVHRFAVRITRAADGSWMFTRRDELVAAA